MLKKDADNVHGKTKWVRVKKGTAEHPQVTCRLVAQELALGKRLDELLAGTPSISAVRLLLLHSMQDGRCIMAMDFVLSYAHVTHGVQMETGSGSWSEHCMEHVTSSDLAARSE